MAKLLSIRRRHAPGIYEHQTENPDLHRGCRDCAHVTFCGVGFDRSPEPHQRHTVCSHLRSARPELVGQARVGEFSFLDVVCDWRDVFADVRCVQRAKRTDPETDGWAGICRLTCASLCENFFEGLKQGWGKSFFQLRSARLPFRAAGSSGFGFGLQVAVCAQLSCDVFK